MRCIERVSPGTYAKAGLIIIGLLSVPLYGAGNVEAGWGWVETIGRWFNLLILFGAIYLLARKPVAEFLISRREGIQKEIREAHAARKAAEEKLAAMEAKMQGLATELETMKAQAQVEAEVERKRILDQAGEESKKMVTSAEKEIDGLVRAARQNLREYAVELSMEMATRQIADEMNDETQGRVIDRFLVRLADSSREDT